MKNVLVSSGLSIASPSVEIAVVALVEHLDSGIGRVLNTLKELDLDKNIV